MKTRIVLMALTLALAMCVTGITMTGCGKIDYIGFDSYGGGDDGSMFSSSTTLKKALEANPEEPWFWVSGDGLDKDMSVKAAYYFEKGNVIRYDLFGVNTDSYIPVGELSKMTKKEIVAAAAEIWDKELEYKISHANYDPEFDMFDTRTEFKKFKENTDFLTEVAAPRPYELAIYTDGSGNYTESESIKFQKVVMDDDFEREDGAVIGPGKGVFLEKKGCNYKFIYGCYAGQIYDTEYGGFCNKDGEMFVTKIDDPNTEFLLDEQGTKGIVVDPESEE